MLKGGNFCLKKIPKSQTPALILLVSGVRGVPDLDVVKKISCYGEKVTIGS